RPLRGQIKLVPKHLEKIIPTVAKFHAHTFESHYLRYEDTFNAWVPSYYSNKKNREKTKHIEKTKKHLERGMENQRVRKVLEPHYDVLQNVLQKGPIFSQKSSKLVRASFMVICIFTTSAVITQQKLKTGKSAS